jgi:hypothetical protein
MKTEATDEKLAALIREVQARKKLNPPVAKSTWSEIMGTSPGDDLDQEAARLGEEWRRSEGISE